MLGWVLPRWFRLAYKTSSAVFRDDNNVEMAATCWVVFNLILRAIPSFLTHLTDLVRFFALSYIVYSSTVLGAFDLTTKSIEK